MIHFGMISLPPLRYTASSLINFRQRHDTQCFIPYLFDLTCSYNTYISKNVFLLACVCVHMESYTLLKEKACVCVCVQSHTLRLVFRWCVCGFRGSQKSDTGLTCSLIGGPEVEEGPDKCACVCVCFVCV